ncbi:DUF5330 domain-containing protein [Taklimakanibacter deserti]|uniref:DUF5330 domain-containing protein n=1 Tax=Taklimakanibacter deserti TaxID=2267839 RepID=UPI0013C48681
MRIIRTIALLAVVAFFMPSPPEERFQVAETDDPPATELLSAAVSTVADVGDFCRRQPAVCDTAHYLAVKLEGKAKYSIELLYQWAHESNGLALPQQTVAADEGEAAGQNTLRLDDLIPEWRAPKPQAQS